MEDELYITVTGLSHYHGMKPFRIGSLISLKKEPGNEFDAEAIAVFDPLKGQVGYVANSPSTIAKGCMSAGRVYDRMPDECAAVVRFMTQTKVIARVMPNRKVVAKVEISLQNAAPEDHTQIIDLLSKLFSSNDNDEE